MISPALPEPLYFYLTGNWYTGKMPNFYDVSQMESTRILEENYSRLKDEILRFFETNEADLKPNFTPYNYKEEGWRTINLHAFMLQSPENIAKLPVLNEVARSIPNMVTAQVAVLEPRTRVKAHFGDSNAIIRNHLGIVVPGKYPDLGFRNGSKEQCWEEGKVLAICIAHRHYVWNNTDHKRIIVLLDTIHPAYAHKKLWICSGLLSAAVLKLIATRFPITRKTPHGLLRAFHKIVALPIMLILWAQNTFNFYLASLWNKLKVDL
jgi:aspartyl/asparaginyl beta-hydroxylase (cupin superfamily)